MRSSLLSNRSAADNTHLRSVRQVNTRPINIVVPFACLIERRPNFWAKVPYTPESSKPDSVSAVGLPARARQLPVIER